jgi:hypothetical protein
MHADYPSTWSSVWQKGNSVLCHVHGFRPYFYVAAPPGFLSSDCTAFQDRLNVRPMPLANRFPPANNTPLNLIFFGFRRSHPSHPEINHPSNIARSTRRCRCGDTRVTLSVRSSRSHVPTRKRFRVSKMSFCPLRLKSPFEGPNKLTLAPGCWIGGDIYALSREVRWISLGSATSRTS